ncbi:FAD-binding oxidoreductase [soil metagenome]
MNPDREDRLATELAAIVGRAHVIDDPEVLASYETDWTGRFSGRARCAVRPATTDQIVGVLSNCSRAGVAVVTQGGNTGLVGGSVPKGGEVVLSTTRLADVEPVDPIAAQVTVGAGVTLARLQDHARAARFDFGVDLAARDTATVGGLVATNAGGVHVLHYGSMRQQVLGVEAVLADGRVVRRLSGLVKDNSGYDLPGLLVGSEGTLGVVTRARLRLVPLLPERVVALLATSSLAAALALFARLRAHLASLVAVEAIFADGVDLVCEHFRLAPPFARRHPVLLLVECADRDDPTDALAAVLADAPELLDAAVADDAARRDALWAYRELHTDAINAAGVPHKLDVTLPLAALADFGRSVRAEISALAPGARTVLFGHLGDGNLHVSVLGLEADDERVDERVLALVASLGGSISAEHGIGRAKARWLHLTRDADDIAAMRSIKRALDPTGLLSPGVLFAEPAV